MICSPLAVPHTCTIEILVDCTLLYKMARVLDLMRIADRDMNFTGNVNRLRNCCRQLASQSVNALQNYGIKRVHGGK